MEKKTIIKNITIALILMLTFIYFVLFSIWEIWGNYFKVNEWIIFCATVVTTLIGVYATIIAVLISIEYSKNQKKDEQREKLRRINIIVYTEILEYIISVKKSFYEYVWGRECNFESESVNENFKIIIPDIKPEIKDLIYELMIYDTNKNIGTIKNIYDYYIKNKKMIETNYNIEEIIYFLVENILGDECKDILFCTINKPIPIYTREELLGDYWDFIDDDIDVEPIESDKEFLPLDTKQMESIFKFLKKYRKNKNLIKENKDIEEALKYLLGEIKN
ncbi:MAG: hypothetical protein ACLRYN_15205 [Clostridium perfringens]|uniref:hypothetical protein n=3 Tax=Clostridium perfringens TaxID=1502 RepID=UPI002148ABFB|nr:hypothetical protein [Clostridium perfringens]UUR79716.1 hypothetical protein NQ196_07780 [Clostridium perfringens]